MEPFIISDNVSLSHVLNYVNISKLPEPLRKFASHETGIFSFFDILYELERRYIIYEPKNEEEIKFKLIFRCIIDFYTNKHEECLFFIDKILFEYPELEVEIVHYFLEIKYKIQKMINIIIYVDYNFDDKVKFKTLSKLSEINSINLVVVKKFNEQLFDIALSTFDQMFIFAHGDDTGTTLGDTKLAASWISNRFVINKRKRVNILGIFSCQDEFGSSNIAKHVDYFMTDSVQSGPRQSEIFCYSYLKNYFETFNISNSFQHGVVSLLFILTGRPYLKIFEKGVDISDRII